MTYDLPTAADARGRLSDQRPPLWISLPPLHTQNSGYFPACLLDRMVFRTKPQFEAGIRALYRSNLQRQIFQNEPDLHLVEVLRGKKDPGIRLVPVICDNDPPTKSGPFVMRRLQRIFKLNQRWMCWPWQASASLTAGDIHTVLFVDDFLGSGNQFDDFVTHWNFDLQNLSVEFLYAPVVASRTGLSLLKSKFPRLKTAFAETLEAAHGFFSDEVWTGVNGVGAALGGGVISAANAQAWYLQFTNDRKICGKSADPLGYGQLALTFGFSHSTPDNSLPILWRETADWNPLLER